MCEVVSRRASFMASAGITALLKKMDYKDVVIAIDGSLFRYYFLNSIKAICKATALIILLGLILCKVMDSFMDILFKGTTEVE